MDEFDCPVNLDPEIICRICLESNKTPLNDLFVKEIVDGEILTLPTVFQQLFRIKIFRNDKLPQRICSDCKQNLILLTKFKRKCENSNKVLHDLLQPGYDFMFVDPSPLPEVPKEVSKSDFSCQTIEPETVEVIPARSDDELFEAGVQFYRLKEKVEKVYENIGEDLFDLCNQYAYFEPTAENFCAIEGCSERISTVVVLQNHMRDKHPTELKDFIERLVMAENEPVDIGLEPEKAETKPEQYTITETNDLVQVEDYEEEEYFEVVEEETKFVKNEREDRGDSNNIIEITNVSYHCPICHKLYQGHDEIEKHRILHAIVLPTLFESIDHYCCEICKAVFISYDQIKDHFTQGHESIDVIKPGLDREYGTLPSIQTKLFLFKEQTSDVITTVEGEHAFLEMFETFALEEEVPLICGICQKSYNSIEAMKYHTFGHFSTFNCPFSECDAEFDFSYKLLSHMRYTHFKEKTLDLTCQYCREQFSNKKEYGVHLKEKCSKRTVECEVCSKKFINQAALKNHLKIHEKHKCEECDETYLSSSDLRQHRRKFHANDEKVYKCAHCPKRLRTPSHRADHEMTHATENKFKCDICHNFFKSERVCKSHRKLHTIGRSHACPVCGKMFNRNYHVKLHMKTHKEKTT